ncbi:MAG: hypothetical protein AMXMBFR84_17410 [Candidatus Hydrogenedentota bacterium]
MRSFTLLLFLAGVFAHAELRVLPGDIRLNYQGATHQLVVGEFSGDRWRSDLTAQAAFTSSNPAVVTVDASGTLHAAGNGVSTVTASVGTELATIQVTVAGADVPVRWSFANHIQPILFKMGCNTGACHGAQAGKNGFRLSLRGYDHDWDHKALTRQANGRRISLAEPRESLILLKATASVTHEGGERFPVESEPYTVLRQWIEDGAQPVSPDDRKLERIEVFPKTATLAPNAAQQILVQAHYDDGSYEDVTRWVKFGTSDDTVALVDDLGKVTVIGSGVSSITVYFNSKVASASLTIPHAVDAPEALFANAASYGFVDELILKQLRNLRIAPAAIAPDEVFIRRAYLDCLGILPTPEEAQAFIADTNPAKRKTLVKSLLDRPEFVDYWSYKWSELLLVSSRNLPKREEMTALYQFIRENVAANTPWDEFVRKIVTAKGSTLENGAANYFVMHKQPDDLTETTSQAFLGMSITCARCHNHPLEKWTQDDYFGMANLLARVTLKNGKRGTDTVVLPAASGDIIHPRLGRPVEPKPLDGEAIPLQQAGDRREYLAAWLTSPENPYFTKAFVNRVWTNFMGRGLVAPEDDLRLTNPPTNALLFDMLARDTKEYGFDLKHLIYTIMTSAAYQRSSQPANPAIQDDKHYSQYVARRLSAEVILDAYSQATGVPTEFSGYPSGFRALQLPDSQVASYFLAAFGRPQRNQTCSCERTDDSSVAQTLHVANGDTLNGKLQSDKAFLTELANQKIGDDAAITAMYWRAYSRAPLPDELAQSKAILSESPADGDSAERRMALEDMMWALLSSKEFLFNH